MKGNIIIALSVLAALPFVRCDCEILDEKNNKFVGAFQDIGKQIYQLPETEQLTLKTDSYVYLICPGGFDLKGLDGNQTRSIKVKCMSSGYTQYGSFGEEHNFVINEITKQETVYNSYNYRSSYVTKTYSSKNYPCQDTTFKIFQGDKKESRCDQASYAVGYQLGDKVIVLLEFCYDALYKRLDFIHYFQAPKTHLISEAFNPVNASQALIASLPVNEFFKSLPTLGSTKYLSTKLFTMNPIISYSIFKPYPKEYFPTMEKMTNIIWLRNLLEGETLELFNQLLEKRKEEVQYEIFQGVSGKVSVPNTSPSSSCSCSNETIKKEELNVPRYIWTYMKSQDDGINEEFVIVGVNTPFAEHGHWNETVFCEDVCDTIKWLKPMEEIRKMPYMGYMFCCKADEEVASTLDGFPSLK